MVLTDGLFRRLELTSHSCCTDLRHGLPDLEHRPARTRNEFVLKPERPFRTDQVA